MHNLTKIKLFRIVLGIAYPFAWLFIRPFAVYKKRKVSRYIFFFDRYSLGGAQKVHLDILNVETTTFKQVYFTRRSPDDTLKNEFFDLPNTATKDIHFWCDNLFFRIFTIHYYAFLFNRNPPLVIFGSNSTFFYDLLYWIKNKQIKKIELLHNFTYGKKGMEFFGLANYRHLDNRLVVDAYTLENIRNQYKEYNIPGTFLQRVVLTEPGISMHPIAGEKDLLPPLKILYAGRGGPQKRIHLITKIAGYFILKKMPVEFHFAGTAIDELPGTIKKYAVLHGIVTDPQKLLAIYDNAHVLLMTSAYEGFPMFIKEGMARGCVPVVTALEGNKTHLVDGDNALLIDEIKDEEKLVEQAIERLKSLLENNKLLRKLSQRAASYAQQNFGKEKFIEKYRKLLDIQQG